MIVKVEACWGGHENYSFRLTLPDGRRFSVTGHTWTRSTARYALNILEREYGAYRISVKFRHK
jgi:hypothetical protein